MGYSLKPNESVESGVRRIAQEQLKAALEELQSDELERHKAVHQVRTRCKKLRALVRLVRPVFADYELENAAFRDAAGSLSGVRDAESTIQAFDKLLKHYEEELENATFASVRAGLDQRRRKLIKEDVDLDERLEKVAHNLKAAHERAGDWSLQSKGFDAIEDGLIKTYRRGRDAMAAAYEDRTAENFHEWRKRAKYHGHHVRLVREVWKSLMKQRSKALKELTDLLGDDHDLAVLRQLLLEDPDTFGKCRTVQATIGLLDRRRLELQDQAESLGKRLYAGSPKKVGQRTRRYWKVWRKEAARA